MADHLILKSGTWHVRLDVPEDLRNAIGRRVLSKSLKTGSKAEANIKKLAVLADWKSLFEEARRKQASDEWREKAQESGFEVARTRREAKFVAIGEEPSEKITPEEAARIPELIAQAVEHGVIDEADGVALLNHLIWTLEALRDTSDLKHQLLLRAELANMVGYFDAAKITKEHGLSYAKQEELFNIISSPNSFKPKSPFTPTLLERFSTFQAQKKEIVPRTVSQMVSKLERFGKFLESSELPLDFESVSLFFDSLNCSPKTKQQYIFAGNSLWKWASKYEKAWKEAYRGADSPFLNHDIPKTSNSPTKKGYAPFSQEEIELLHQVALEREDIDLADAIAIGAYTGCRLEEIGRISSDLITFDSNKPFSFKIAKAKTNAGERELPFHCDIIPIIERRLASSPDGYIFSGPTNKNGERLNALGKRFGRLKNSLGFGPRHVFHSLRNTFTDTLRHANVPYTTVAYLDGHKINHITYDTYSSGPSVEQKLEAIGNVKFNFKI